MSDQVFCLDACKYDPNYVVKTREIPPPIHADGCPRSDARTVAKAEHYEN